jgi:hypothetical protein
MPTKAAPYRQIQQNQNKTKQKTKMATRNIFLGQNKKRAESIIKRMREQKLCRNDYEMSIRFLLNLEAMMTMLMF